MRARKLGIYVEVAVDIVFELFVVVVARVVEVFDDFVEVAVAVEVFVAVFVADGVEDAWKIGDSVAAA